MQVSFALPMEALRNIGMRGTVFADTGSIAQISGQSSVHEGLSTFWNQWRLSMGVGIKVPFATHGHLEMNFVQTLKQFEGDRARTGFQIGFSADPYMCIPPRYM
jgi:outer membrane protein assembly factor BamA